MRQRDLGLERREAESQEAGRILSIEGLEHEHDGIATIIVGQLAAVGRAPPIGNPAGEDAVRVTEHRQLGEHRVDAAAGHGGSDLVHAVNDDPVKQAQPSRGIVHSYEACRAHEDGARRPAQALHQHALAGTGIAEHHHHRRCERTDIGLPNNRVSVRRRVEPAQPALDRVRGRRHSSGPRKRAMKSATARCLKTRRLRSSSSPPRSTSPSSKRATATAPSRR